MVRDSKGRTVFSLISTKECAEHLSMGILTKRDNYHLSVFVIINCMGLVQIGAIGKKAMDSIIVCRNRELNVREIGLFIETINLLGDRDLFAPLPFQFTGKRRNKLRFVVPRL